MVLLESGDRLLLESGDDLLLEDVVQLFVPPASATASAAGPAAAFSVTPPPASATASGLAPTPTVVLTLPPASATAEIPAPTAHGTSRRDDLPTTLTFSYGTEMVLAYVREIALYERTTALALMEPGAALDLFEHVSEMTLGRVTTLALYERTTTLELSMETTLELHDREPALVLDG
jgi:hypothetical protein